MGAAIARELAALGIDLVLTVRRRRFITNRTSASASV